MKFKVWDKDGRRWKKTKDADDQREYFLINSDGKLMQVFDAFRRNETYIDYAFERYTPVFSAEIIDKNGVELFKGDLIKIFSNITEITLYNGCFGYWPQGLEWKFLAFGSHDHLKFDKIGKCDEIEKIGSKYENPELLK